ncbi:hypothetical protein [Bordetella bronchialis]|uniref:Uncharacterized protein n=1 Tax=Bordetella bronchialis TaxID=463025 RepID=A0A193FWW0_9BORD|nr:hypothetical protein [Bordetella bronchialis]ANN71843.1 hypothetical protein BAU08_11360 [Bordetella bronchialis]
MSVATVNAIPALPHAANAAPLAPREELDGAAQALASYRARQARLLSPPLDAASGAGAPAKAGGQPVTPMPDAQARLLARWHDILDLRENVGLIKRAETELNAAIRRMDADPALGPTSPAADRVGVRQATLDYVVAEAKKSGLHDALTQAAVQRLKASGNYEALIDRVVASEATQGRTRDRAWAEKWIERQFDPDSIDAGFRAGEPYFDLRVAYEGVWPYVGNKGSAAVYGDKASVQANGPFRVEFGRTEGADGLSLLTYTVENQRTGEKSAPRPYDERGTVVEAEGLRAGMYGAPAPGDVFSFDTPPEYTVRYPDANNPIIDVDNQKAIYKTMVFDRLFQPSVRSPDMGTPTQTVLTSLDIPL